MDDNLRNAIWVGLGIACCAVCIVAGFKSVDEFRYSLSGRQTSGRVRSIVEEPPQGPRVGYTVWYEFIDQSAGKRIRSWSYVDAADRSKYASGKVLAVEYIDGPFVKSRIQGTGSRFWPLLFAVSSLATIACIVTLTVAAIRKSREEPDAESTDVADESADSQDDEHGDEYSGQSRGDDGDSPG